MSRTTAEEESTERTEATPEGSLVARGRSAAGSISVTRPRVVTRGPLPWRGMMLTHGRPHPPSRARSRFDRMRTWAGAAMAALRSLGGVLQGFIKKSPTGHDQPGEQNGPAPAAACRAGTAEPGLIGPGPALPEPRPRRPLGRGNGHRSP